MQDISFSVKEKDFLAIAGHTGSGKSTLIQIIAGLINLEVGGVEVDGESIKNKSARQKIGMVFQYPEYQLFEETVEKDIAFGPRNFGLSEDEIEKKYKNGIVDRSKLSPELQNDVILRTEHSDF